jgi:Undecaprenyl-phosphate glucose phosphotransferase
MRKECVSVVRLTIMKSGTMTVWEAAHLGPGSQTILERPDLGGAPFSLSKGARKIHSFIPLLLLFEFAIVCAAAYLGSVAYHQATHSDLAPFERRGGFVTFVALLVILSTVTLRQFVDIQTQPRYRFVLSSVSAVALAFAWLLSALFFLKISEDYSRGAFAVQFAFICIAVFYARATTYLWIQTALARGFLEARRIVLIGDEDHCATFIGSIDTPGMRTIASLSIPTDTDAQSPRPFGPIVSMCRTVAPDDVVIVCDHQAMGTARALASALSELPIGVHIFDVGSTGLLMAARLIALGHAVTLQISRPPLSAFDQAVKRIFDLVVAIAALTITFPLLVLAAIAIRLESPGPILFRQTRHGFNNQVIRVFKLRTMVQVEAPDAWTQAMPGDKRVTRVGAILRRLSIDELPQLLNVIAGEMSVVGPRPHLTAHNRAFEPRIAHLSRRHRVKPGITGWAQVNGYRGQTDTLEKMQRRVEHDLFYIENWSLLLDVKIVIMTVLSKKTYSNAI